MSVRMSVSVRNAAPDRVARAVRCIIAGAVLAGASSLALADSEGTIVGIVTNATKVPVAHATGGRVVDQLSGRWPADRDAARIACAGGSGHAL